MAKKKQSFISRTYSPEVSQLVISVLFAALGWENAAELQGFKANLNYAAAIFFTVLAVYSAYKLINKKKSRNS